MTQKMSSRILKEARAQQAELDLEEAEGPDGQQEGQQAVQLLSSGALAAALQHMADSDDDDDGGGLSDTDSVWAPGVGAWCRSRSCG